MKSCSFDLEASSNVKPLLGGRVKTFLIKKYLIKKVFTPPPKSDKSPTSLPWTGLGMQIVHHTFT